MGYKVKRIMLGTQQVRPDKMPGYQEVEYIQSSGSQYINTGYIGTQDTKIEATINIVSRNANYDMPYGSTSTGTGGYPCMFIQSNYPENNKLRIVNYINSGSGKIYIDSINNLQYNKTFSIIHANTTFIIDGVTQGTCSSSTFTLDYPFYIFCCNDHSRAGVFCNMRLYSFKIYSGTTLQRDFVPCYRKSDNVIGLYDLVNNQFYTNSGSGTFTKGPNVN